MQEREDLLRPREKPERATIGEIPVSISRVSICTCRVGPYWNSVQGNTSFNHERSLMCIKVVECRRKLPSRLVCGSHGACLDCMLPGFNHRWAGVLSAFTEDLRLLVTRIIKYLCTHIHTKQI